MATKESPYEYFPPEPGEHFCKNCGEPIFFGNLKWVPSPYDKFDPERVQRDGTVQWRHMVSGGVGCNPYLFRATPIEETE